MSQLSLKFLQSQPFYELFHKLYIMQDNYIVYYSLQFSCLLNFQGMKDSCLFQKFPEKEVSVYIQLLWRKTKSFWPEA